MRDTIVIIQGLLKHKGGGPNPTPAGFGGVDYLVKNSENALKFGFGVRFLCWESDYSNFPEKQLHQLEKHQKFKLEVIRDYDKQDTKYKQIGSLYEYINNHDEILMNTLIIKIRTDMLMPDSFWEWIKKTIMGQIELNEKVYVSEMNNITGYVGDFVIVATKEKFIEEFLKYVSKSHIDLHPGNYDIGLKIIGDNARSLKIITRKATRKKWIEYVGQNLGTIPTNIFGKIVWRGKQVDEVLNLDKFIDPEEITHKKYRIEDFKSLLYVYSIYRKRGFESNKVMNILLSIQFLYGVCNAISRKVKNYNPLRRKKIFARVACFGRIVIEDRNIIRNNRVSNFQKARIDYINQIMGGEIQGYAENRDLDKIITNIELQDFQKQNISIKEFNFSDVDIYLIDTFSDLTDRKFTINSGEKYFFSHYGDLDVSYRDFENIKDNGMLDLGKIRKEYHLFIERVTLINPSSQIIFIHYPSKFEYRMEYVQRGEEIATVLTELSKKYKQIQNIFLSEGQVISKDSFPYHYAEETNNILKYEISRKIN